MGNPFSPNNQEEIFLKNIKKSSRNRWNRDKEIKIQRSKFWEKSGPWLKKRSSEILFKNLVWKYSSVHQLSTPFPKFWFFPPNIYDTLWYQLTATYHTQKDSFNSNKWHNNNTFNGNKSYNNNILIAVNHIIITLLIAISHIVTTLLIAINYIIIITFLIAINKIT